MSKKEKEPIAWITRGGKHIPIFADDPSDDEKKKDRQIKKNKKEADEKNGRYSSQFETSGNVEISEDHWKQMQALRKKGISKFMDTDLVDDVDEQMRQLGDNADADILYLYDKLEDDVTEDEMYAIYHMIAEMLK